MAENPDLVPLDWGSHAELFNQPSPPPSLASSRFWGGLPFPGRSVLPLEAQAGGRGDPPGLLGKGKEVLSSEATGKSLT